MPKHNNYHSLADSQGVTTRLTKQTQLSSTTIYSDRSSVPAELCVDRVDGWARQLNSRYVRRPAGLAAYRYGNGALCVVVCDDPMHREQTGSGRPGAKGLLHID
jgi:hypothetical protein